MNRGGGRRACAELRWAGDADPCARVGERTVHHYWAVLSPYFREVLLAPRRRTEGDGVAWMWTEPGERGAASARELKRVRVQLDEAQAWMAESLGRQTGTTPRAGVEELPAVMAGVIATLVGRSDAELGAFMARTEQGWRVHSWGCPSAAPVTYPDDLDARLAGNAGRAAPAVAGQPRRRAVGGWWAAVTLGLVVVGVLGWRMTGRARAPLVSAPEDVASLQEKPSPVAQPGGTEWERGRAPRAESAHSGQRERPAAANEDRTNAWAADDAPVTTTRQRVVAVFAPPAAPQVSTGEAGAAGGDGKARGASSGKMGEATEPQPGNGTTIAHASDDVEGTAKSVEAVAPPEGPAEESLTDAKVRRVVRVEVAEDATKPARENEAEREGDGARRRGGAVAVAESVRAAPEESWSEGELFVAEWRPRRLVDVILPTLPVRMSDAGARLTEMDSMAEARRVPETLSAVRVRWGIAVRASDGSLVGVRSWGAAGGVQREGDWIEGEIEPRTENFELREAGGRVVARVRRGETGWQVAVRVGWELRGWGEVEPAGLSWRRVSEEGLPSGWTTKGGRVEFVLGRGPMRHDVALFDEGSGWASVSRIAWSAGSGGR